MSRVWKIAIVGATGMVGRAFIKVLEERKLSAEYTLFASARSAGKTMLFNGKEYIVEELTENSFPNGRFDIALFSAGGGTSLKFAPIVAKSGCIVVDNSSAWRMDASVPLVVPEVNAASISWNKGIIANPNCSTIQAVVPLAALHKKFGLKRVIYSTYQAVSGAGMGGVGDFEGTAKGEPPQKWPHAIYNNCLPHIDVFLENGYTKEEQKMIDETRKILGLPDLAVTATCVRVPVLNSHSESINVQFEQDFTIKEVREALQNAEGVVLYDDIANNIYPLATVANDNDNIYVGRLRRDDSAPNSLNMWVVSDNIRKGAATNAVQIAECIMKGDF